MEFVGSVWSLLPPVIAIVLALITKEVYLSLFIGIFTGSLLYSGFNILGTVNTIFDVMIGKMASEWNIGILIFLVFLGTIVALMNKAGGSAAYGKWANEKIKTKKGAMLATFGLGVLIFVDDYFNCLTVGSVMRPVTDRFNISRSKLAYLIDSTAAPICIIAPISSWAAAVTGYTSGDGFNLFLHTIPFNLYALLTISMVVFIAASGFDYGPMKKHEENAMNGDLFSGTNDYPDKEEAVNEKGKIIDLVLPVLFLIFACITSMIYTGGFFEGTPFVEAFSNCDAARGLVLGSFVSLVFTFVLYIPRKIINFKEFAGCIPEGFKMMTSAILILILAWTLGGIVADKLEAGTFVANALAGTSIATSILPAVLFLISLGLAFATGTSWGTFAILIPIVTAIYPDGSTALVIGIASILAGAVCGDHSSPISDTTIMSSAGAQCNHVNHVATQIPYAMTVGLACVIGYLVAGFTENLLLTLVVSFGCLALELAIIMKKSKKAEKKTA